MSRFLPGDRVRVVDDGGIPWPDAIGDTGTVIDVYPRSPDCPASVVVALDKHAGRRDIAGLGFEPAQLRKVRP